MNDLYVVGRLVNLREFGLKNILSLLLWRKYSSFKIDSIMYDTLLSYLQSKEGKRRWLISSGLRDVVIDDYLSKYNSGLHRHLYS